MAELTQEQRHFLRDQKIPLSMVFDATGMKRSEYQRAMEETGKHFAFGVSPCKKSAHTLRSRSGNCIQCNTRNIAEQLRHYTDGIVYLAGSRVTKNIKVGMTTDLESRVKMLNQYQYGQAKDWEILLSVRSENAGEMEFRVHKLLSVYSVEGWYSREGRKTMCYELFKCSYHAARTAMAEIFPDKHFKIHSSEDRLNRIYW